MEFQYKCENCGACCRHWNPARYNKEIVNEKGDCIYLDINTKLCTIYNNRPDFCRVNKWYNLHFSNIKWEHYTTQQILGCNILRKLEGL